MYSYTTCIQYRISILYSNGPSHNHNTIHYGKPYCKYRGHVGTDSHVYSVWKPLTLLDMASCHRRKVPSLYGATSTMERAGPCFRDDGSENF